jgi:hypothetical protein
MEGDLRPLQASMLRRGEAYRLALAAKGGHETRQLLRIAQLGCLEIADSAGRAKPSLLGVFAHRVRSYTIATPRLS